MYGAGDARFSWGIGQKEYPYQLTVEVPDAEFHFLRTRERQRFRGLPIKTYRFPDAVHRTYRNSGLLSDLEVSFEQTIDRLHYLGPLREPPSRDYLWARSRPTDRTSWRSSG